MAQASSDVSSDDDSSRKAKPNSKYSSTLSGTELLFLRKCCPSELEKFESEVGSKITVKTTNQGSTVPLSGLDRAQYDVTITSDKLTSQQIEAKWKELVDYAQKKLRRVVLTVSETQSADVDALCKTVKEVMKKMGKVFISNTDDKSVTVSGLGMFPNMLRSFVMEAVSSSSQVTTNNRSDTESDESVEEPKKKDTASSSMSKREAEIDQPSTSKGATYSRVVALSASDSEDSGSEFLASKSTPQAKPAANFSVPTWQPAVANSAFVSVFDNPRSAFGSASTQFRPASKPEASALQLEIGRLDISNADQKPTTVPKPSQLASTALKCDICKNNMHKTLDPLASTPCGHTFHKKCLENASIFSSSCPTCRFTCNTDRDTSGLRAAGFFSVPRSSPNRSQLFSRDSAALRRAKDQRNFSSSNIVRRNTKFDIVANPQSIPQLRQSRNMPQGQLQVRVEQEICVSDYPDHGCIILLYTFPNAALGERGNPGEPIAAYLPDTPQGRRVSTLLQAAFHDRWTFVSIGQNTQSGVPMIAWGPLTHKTELFGDPEAPNFYSYPDPGYLDRVTKELELLGFSSPSNTVDSD